MTITPPNRYVYSEQLLKGDLMHTLMIGYKQPAWSIMAGIHNPYFGRQYKGANKGIQNIDTDSGILQGTKE